ncbi:MAG: S8 family serine peptidase [Bacteroidota bacterium]
MKRSILFLILSCWFLQSWATDTIRVLTRVDLAHEIFDASGEGTLVAILDRGLDWEHPDFRNDDGSTRIAYIFDLTDNSGANAPGNTYGVGTIYTEADINAALNGGTPLATRDAVGHGVTTTGIATGNGRGLPDRRYQGVAPKAKLLVIKVTSDGAPAHGNQPAEAAFFNPDLLPTAIDFAKDKAIELNLPVVMLLNLGSTGGPTDGTSSLCRKIDEVVGPGKDGIIFVTGSGDDGNMNNRTEGTLQQGQTIDVVIQKNGNSALILDLWYDGDDRFDVEIITPSGSTGPLPAPTNNNASSSISNNIIQYFHNGKDVTFFGADNDHREIWLRLLQGPGTYTIRLTGTTISNGFFQGTLNPSRAFLTALDNQFTTFTAPGNIWDGATAFYNICPNSYIGRTTWTDINGIPRSFSGQGDLFDIWLGSSIGPTFDGRIGIDVSAPGDRVITSYGPNSWWATFDFNVVQGGNGLYGMASAVSAAAPIVTGTIALMLELDPNLDAAEAKAILQMTAIQDAFTGPVPNTTWGHGKLDAFAACRYVYESQSNPAIKPINLLAQSTMTEIQLDWQNLSTNATEIQLERSTDNLNFSPIDTISASQTNYSDADVVNNTTYYYRIRAVNSFGPSDYSNVADATAGVLTDLDDPWLAANLQLYPNPATEWMKIVFDSPLQESIQMKMVSIEGKVVGEKLLSDMENEIYVGGMLPGIYLLQFQTQSGIWSRKIIVE